MCIRDRSGPALSGTCTARSGVEVRPVIELYTSQGCSSCPRCLLYTSDAADERSSVDLGGRRIIKKKTVASDRGETSKNNKHTGTKDIICIEGNIDGGKARQDGQ